MSALNNLQGTIVKDGKVVYLEKIEGSLFFAVVLFYSSFYSGANKNNYQSSSKLECDALMINGNGTEKYTYSNGVIGLSEATIIEQVEISDIFEPIRHDLKTKDGFRIWQKDYQYNEFETHKNDLKVKMKSRRVTWLIEVPKIDLLRYCIGD